MSRRLRSLFRGLAGLKGLPETPERHRWELELQLALGPALFSLHGFGAAQAQAAYELARVLAGSVGDDHARFAAVWGCWLTAHNKTSPSAADNEALSDELSRVAERLGDPALRLQAHHSAWATVMGRGGLQRPVSMSGRACCSTIATSIATTRLSMAATTRGSAATARAR